MAKFRFTTNTTEVLKKKYVVRKTHNILLWVLALVSLSLLAALTRLYFLGDFANLLPK